MRHCARRCDDHMRIQTARTVNRATCALSSTLAFANLNMMQLSHTPRLCRPAALPQQQQLLLRRRFTVCRWAPDSKDEQAPAADTPTAADAGASDPTTSRRLINQLLQIQSVQSLQSIALSSTEEQELSAAELGAGAEQPGVAPGGSSEPAPCSLFDDPAAADYDPLVLDMLGFSSVSQYLDSKLAAAAGEAKVSLAAVLTWALVTCAVAAPLGGTDAYTDSIAILTEGALQMGNLVYLWAALLGYFSIKSGVMAVVTGIRSWRLHEAQGETLEELATTVQAADQRRAFWRLQEKLQHGDERAQRTYAEFALSSLLLGVLLVMGGGADHLQLQLETVDEEAYLNLLVILWLFWESYFAVVGSVVEASNWVSAALAKWQYTRKWGSAGTRSRQ